MDAPKEEEEEVVVAASAPVEVSSIAQEEATESDVEVVVAFKPKDEIETPQEQVVVPKIAKVAQAMEEEETKSNEMTEVDLKVAFVKPQANGKLLVPPADNQPVEFKANGKTLNEPVKAAKDGDERVGYVRHIIALLALSSIVLANANRQAFNQALVSMTRDKPSAATETTNLPENDTLATTIFPTSQTTELDVETTTSRYDPITNLLVGSEGDSSGDSPRISEEDDDKFDWTPKQIALLQSAFSYGYTPFMIPGGRMSEVYGAKWVVFASGFGSALCCLFAPFFADWHYNLLVMSRVLMGLSQTGVSPALYALLARWLPSEESSVYLPMIKVAVQLGFMSGSLFSGFFTWRMTFFQVGLVGIVWSAIWVVFVSSEPKEHKFLSKNELHYIQREIGKHTKSIESSKKETKTKQSAPWLAIVTNPIVLAFMFAKFTVKLSTDTQSMQIPMYLSKVFHVSKELNGTLSALNFAIQGIFTGFVAWLAKEFVVRKWLGLSKTGVRRLFQGFCNFGMAFSYIMMTFNMGDLNLVCCAVIMLSVFSMFGAGGEPLTPIDLSIEYSASIMAIANSMANLSGIILPPIVSFVLGGELDNAARWDAVLTIVATIVAIGGLLYCLVVRAELLDFSKRSKSTKKPVDKEEESFTAIEMSAQITSKV